MPSRRATAAALSRFWQLLPPFVLEVVITPKVARLGLAGAVVVVGSDPLSHIGFEIPLKRIPSLNTLQSLLPFECTVHFLPGPSLIPALL